MKKQSFQGLRGLGLWGLLLIFASPVLGQPCANLDVFVSPQAVRPGELVTVMNKVGNCSTDDEILAVNVKLADPNGVSLTKSEFVTVRASHTHSVTMKFDVPGSSQSGDYTVTSRVITAGTPLATQSAKLHVK